MTRELWAALVRMKKSVPTHNVTRNRNAKRRRHGSSRYQALKRPVRPLDSRSTLNRLACCIPMHGLLAVIRFIGHVASQCRMMAEYRVLYDRLARAHRLEEGP